MALRTPRWLVKANSTISEFELVLERRIAWERPQFQYEPEGEAARKEAQKAGERFARTQPQPERVAGGALTDEYRAAHQVWWAAKQKVVDKIHRRWETKYIARLSEMPPEKRRFGTGGDVAIMGSNLAKRLRRMDPKVAARLHALEVQIAKLQLERDGLILRGWVSGEILSPQEIAETALINSAKRTPVAEKRFRKAHPEPVNGIGWNDLDADKVVSQHRYDKREKTLVTLGARRAAPAPKAAA